MPTPVTPLVIVHEGGQPTRAMPIRTASFAIGRDDDCDLVLPDPSVSGHHADIKSIGDQHIIDDLESDDGIFVDGRRVEFHVLHPRDRVQIGAFELEYLEEDIDSTSTSANRTGWEMDAITYKELVDRQGSIRLDMGDKQAATIISEDDPSQSWKPDEGMTFGPEGVPVDGIGAGARVDWDGRAHVIKRIGWRASLNVNGQLADSHTLMPGDHFQIGKSRFRYQQPK